jgi:hypothetical protein
MNKRIWKIGHILSRRGLIGAACQMRDIAQMRGVEGYDGEAEALRVLDRLYYENGFIDKETWQTLRGALLKKERL